MTRPLSEGNFPLVLKVNILVIEDMEGTLLGVVRDLKKKFGEIAEVCGANTLELAKKFLDVGHFHLVLLDGVMPRVQNEKPELTYTREFYVANLRYKIPTIAFSAMYNNEMLKWGGFYKACYFKNIRQANDLEHLAWVVCQFIHNHFGTNEAKFVSNPRILPA